MQAFDRFFEQISARMENPFESLDHLLRDVASIQLGPQHNVQIQQQQRDMPVQIIKNEHPPQLQGKPIEIQKAEQKPDRNLITFQDFISQSVQAIAQKQQKTLEQVTLNLSALQPEQKLSDQLVQLPQKVHFYRMELAEKVQSQTLKGICHNEVTLKNFITQTVEAINRKQQQSVQQIMENHQAIEPNQDLPDQPSEMAQNNKKPQQYQEQERGSQFAERIVLRNAMTFEDLLSRSMSALIQKQQQAVEQIIEKMSTAQFNQSAPSQPHLNLQKPELQFMGEQLQKLNPSGNSLKQAYPFHQQQSQIPEQQSVENFSFAQQQPITKIQQVRSYCQQLRQHYFNQKLYTDANLTAFVHHVAQTHKDNFYQCMLWSFQQIKALFHKNISNQSNSVKKNPSNRNLESGAEFNLELTMRSKISKQSGINIDRHDSLVYSNATSFGLQPNAHSKEASRQNSQIRLGKRNDELDEIIHIEKTSSKGQIEITENEFSVNSMSDTEPLGKRVPKNIHSRNNAKRSQQSGRSRSSRVLSPSTDNDLLYKQTKTFINEQHDYEIMPLTQQPLHSPQKANIKTFAIQTPDNPIKKSFSIKTYSNNKTQNSHSTQKRSEQSVFSAEISQLESRISRIKETKLLRKIRLEEELKKINMEIEELKIQEENQEHTPKSRIKQKSSHLSSKEKSVYESRIKISDDLEEKKKAAHLVKSLRQQKLSRENQKRNQHKAFNTDLHKQMEDLMRLKYFNEERIKQKRQLEIIERMKHQEVRKIVEQKQKQESVEFLTKLRHGGTGEKIDNMERVESKALLANMNKKIQESPVKRTEESQVVEPWSNPALEKKKQYIKKMRNFTIIKKGREDSYEQALS